MNLHGDLMINLNALFGGYNPNRVYEIIPYILSVSYTHLDVYKRQVNIHPTKTEIKFENEQAIWQRLSASVKESLGKFSEMCIRDRYFSLCCRGLCARRSGIDAC